VGVRHTISRRSARELVFAQEEGQQGRDRAQLCVGAGGPGSSVFELHRGSSRWTILRLRRRPPRDHCWPNSLTEGKGLGELVYTLNSRRAAGCDIARANNRPRCSRIRSRKHRVCRPLAVRTGPKAGPGPAAWDFTETGSQDRLTERPIVGV